jgi:hypothetical protein
MHQKYCGAPLDNALDSTKSALQDHLTNISEHVGANAIFVRLRNQIVAGLYKPTPTVSSFSTCLTEIEGVLDDIIPFVPEECRRDVLTQILSCCVEALERHIHDWDIRLNRREGGVLGLDDIAVVGDDLKVRHGPTQSRGK